jgi:hypothetical protein
MMGGIIAKTMISTPLTKKIRAASAMQATLALLMIFTGAVYSNVFTLIAFTIAIHMCSGFIFNNIYSYCLGRFSQNAGTASGLTGAGIYIVSSTFSYGLVNIYAIKTQTLLGIANLVFIVAVAILFVAFDKYRTTSRQTEVAKERVAA